MASNPESESASVVHQISTLEAQILGDLSGVKLDLQHAREYLALAIPMPVCETRFALFQAAHISYRRAFNRGGEHGLTLTDIAAFGPEDAERHQYHYDQADKLVAHSVNPFEMCRIGVEIKDGKFIAIKTVGTKYGGASDEDAEKWINLISRLEDGPLAEKIERTGNAIAAWLKHQTPDQIQKGPVITGFEPPPPRSSAGKPRHGLKHRR